MQALCLNFRTRALNTLRPIRHGQYVPFQPRSVFSLFSSCKKCNVLRLSLTRSTSSGCFCNGTQYTRFTFTQGAFHALRPHISGAELAFLSAWRHKYSLNYARWRTGVLICKSRCTSLLIFARQVYANLKHWRTPAELLA